MTQTDQQLDGTRRRWLLIVTAASAVLATVPWFRSFGPVTAEPRGLFAAVVTTALAGCLFLLAAGRSGTSKPLRQALVLLTIANVLIAVGNFLRLLLVLGLPAPAIPYLAEVSEFAIWALALLALIRVPLRPVAPEIRWRIAIDLAIAFLGMAFILFVIWMLPGIRNAPPAARQRLMFYNWMELGNLLVLNVVLIRGTVSSHRRAVGWLAAAVGMDTIYLVVFQYLTGLDDFDGRLLNSLFFIDTWLYLVAAVYFFWPPPPTTTPKVLSGLVKTNPLPLVTVFGVGLLLMLFAARSPSPSVLILALGTVLLSLLLLARIVASTRESLRLSREKLAIEQQAQVLKMEAVGRLAGGVAHDFNNLLAVVMANSELALLSLPKGHPSQTDLEEIKRTAARGAALTGRLLALGRRQNLQPRLVAPAVLLPDIRPVLQRTVGEGVLLSLQADGDCGPVWVDPHDFEQSLVNLAANARYVLPPTGGTLSITVRAQTRAEPLVSDHLGAPPGRYVVVTVTDNGTAMDAATRASLFEPFFSTKSHGRGTGLGLAPVFNMVKSAGGGISVVSTAGQGTVIELWLPESAKSPPAAPVSASAPPLPDPIVPASPVAGKPGSAAAAVATGSETILLVEDEAGVRLTLKRILESKGYVVLAAGDAREARLVLAQSSARNVELLLTDVIMPGQNGPMLATDLLRERPRLKVLFMSGYTGDELRPADFAQGSRQLLVKPFTAVDLLARVRQALDEP